MIDIIEIVVSTIGLMSTTQNFMKPYIISGNTKLNGTFQLQRNVITCLPIHILQLLRRRVFVRFFHSIALNQSDQLMPSLCIAVTYFASTASLNALTHPVFRSRGTRKLCDS